MSNGFTVKKRDGSVEKINLDKVHIMVEHACRGLAGVSESQVEMNANLQFFDGIETKDIQEILVRSANDLISLEAPNYQFVAARLLLFGLRKSVYGEHPDQRPDLYDHLLEGTKKGIYDPLLQSFYTEEEWGKINAWIDHDRDYIFTYAGLRQVVDKYLVQDRSTGEVYETPQYMYIMIAATLFKEYPKETRLPMSNDLRRNSGTNQHSHTHYRDANSLSICSFCSVDVDDSLNSIFTSDMAIGRYVAQRAGIGINAGESVASLRSEAERTYTGGPLPKKLSQHRFSVHKTGSEVQPSNFYLKTHIEDITAWRTTRYRRQPSPQTGLSQISKLFCERFIQDGDISLFSPTTFLVSMMLLVLVDLTISMCHEQTVYLERLFITKNSFWTS